MAELHYISAAAAAHAEHAPLEVQHGTFYPQRSEDFFFEYVREQLDAPLRPQHRRSRAG